MCNVKCVLYMNFDSGAINLNEMLLCNVGKKRDISAVSFAMTIRRLLQTVTSVMPPNLEKWKKGQGLEVVLTRGRM